MDATDFRRRGGVNDTKRFEINGERDHRYELANSSVVVEFAATDAFGRIERPGRNVDYAPIPDGTLAALDKVAADG